MTKPTEPFKVMVRCPTGTHSLRDDTQHGPCWEANIHTITWASYATAAEAAAVRDEINAGASRGTRAWITEE